MTRSKSKVKQDSWTTNLWIQRHNEACLFHFLFSPNITFRSVAHPHNQFLELLLQHYNKHPAHLNQPLARANMSSNRSDFPILTILVTALALLLLSCLVSLIFKNFSAAFTTIFILWLLRKCYTSWPRRAPNPPPRPQPQPQPRPQFPSQPWSGYTWDPFGAERERRRQYFRRDKQDSHYKAESKRLWAEEQRHIHATFPRAQKPNPVQQFITWRNQCRLLLQYPELVTKLPYPPRLDCHHPGCTSTSRYLHLCSHGLRKLYGDAGLGFEELRDEYRFWHPNGARVNRVREEFRGEVLGAANEVVQALGGLLERKI